jgi:hypothetical protein
VAVYCPSAFTACLRPRGYPRRPGRRETGVRCAPGLKVPPFYVRHLTYATSCRTSGPQSSGGWPANKGTCRPTLAANTRDVGPTIAVNEPTLFANSPRPLLINEFNPLDLANDRVHGHETQTEPACPTPPSGGNCPKKDGASSQKEPPGGLVMQGAGFSDT